MNLHFFVKLIPIRATFAQDMTPDERILMQRHAAYWSNHMHQGHVHVFGPVMDPAGVYGIGVVDAENEQQVRAFAEADPARTLNRLEIYPMRAVLPTR